MPITVTKLARQMRVPVQFVLDALDDTTANLGQELTDQAAGLVVRHLMAANGADDLLVAVASAQIAVQQAETAARDARTIRDDAIRAAHAANRGNVAIQAATRADCSGGLHAQRINQIVKDRL